MKVRYLQITIFPSINAYCNDSQGSQNNIAKKTKITETKFETILKSHYEILPTKYGILKAKGLDSWYLNMQRVLLCKMILM